MIQRIPVLNVAPVIECGRFPTKATVGESFEVTATITREGHDALGAEVVLTGPDGVRRPPVRMQPAADLPGQDRYVATVAPDATGAWTYCIESWSDPYESWHHAATIKVPAGIDVELMITEGVLILERAAEMPDRSGQDKKTLASALGAARDTRLPAEVRFAALASRPVVAALDALPLRDLVSQSSDVPFYTDVPLALYGAWYELFPRSEGAEYDQATKTWKSGTFRTAMERLPAVVDMGFDIVYLPPIHPIGEVNRKGPNNTLDPAPDDPGSPWAIGSRLGGHDAVHPDLGTIDDFDAFVARAEELGLKVALDFALQAAPDHPWATKHPEWFTTRADGTIAYAENPPKKYQDIYPLNFDNDFEGLSGEILRILRYWIEHGVRVFRVDNPHTKPLLFWEWLLAEIRETDPDVIFLSEAFTRRAMMHALGMVGFHQSYTYFTWQNTKQELALYLDELANYTSHLMRPNLFVNTPDILHEYLQYGGPAAFKIRAAIAATAAPSWGVYAGYELYEHVAVRPGSEEYLDSEKYQLRPRDWAAAAESGRTLAPYIARLNQIRRSHPSLQRLRNLRINRTDDDSILSYSKVADPAHPDDKIIVVINVDPHGARETLVHLNMPELGFDWNDTFIVEDQITGDRWRWSEHNYVRLDPNREPAHILSVRRDLA
jgi:starch synthase (maltosyl-transferring)